MDTCETDREIELENKSEVEADLSTDNGKGQHNYKNLKLFFLLGSLLLTAVALWGITRGIKQELSLHPSAIARGVGVSYTTALPESGYWLFKTLTDGLGAQTRSRTEVFEDNKPLGPAHSFHESIRDVGSGRFSHWGAYLYFTTSDNSDPHTNGRHYKAVITAALPLWMLAGPLFCLVIAAYLNRQMLSSPMKQLAFEPNAPDATVDRKIRWRWGLLAALAMALISLYPQIDLWLTRGPDWQGAYTSLCCDEESYAAYLNGLALGRPRRAQPLEVTNPGKPLYESLFSIQFVPSYLIIFFMRVFSLTTAQAFIMLTPLIAFLSTLMLFYLLASATRDEALAALGALAVLICGTLVARQSAINQFFDWNWTGNFLFLRRYQPTVMFPLLFGFIALIWHSLTKQGRRAWWASIAAGIVFAVLIFSYYYLWTSAAAWLGCLVVVWLLVRRTEWLLLVKRLAPTVIFAILVFPAYAFMVMQRNPAVGIRAGIFDYTHAPDFYRAPQLVAVVTILLLLWAVKKGRASWQEPLVLLTASLALMPFPSFNQQIITGRSVEPAHYEFFTANYVSLLALILSLVILWPRWNLTLVILRRGRSLHFKGCLVALLTCAVIGWGVFEMHSAAAVVRERNVARDLFVPVAKRLAVLAEEHNKNPNDREFVFSPDILIVSDNIPYWAPQLPFWASHVPPSGNLSWDEQRERFFQYLHYCGQTPSWLELALKNNTFVVGVLFGQERYNPLLTSELKPITASEIADQVRRYTTYIATFDRERAQHPEISYVVVNTKSPFDFTNLDKWYTRDSGEQIGPFMLYQLKLR